MFLWGCMCFGIYQIKLVCLVLQDIQIPPEVASKTTAKGSLLPFLFHITDVSHMVSLFFLQPTKEFLARYCLILENKLIDCH